MKGKFINCLTIKRLMKSPFSFLILCHWNHIKVLDIFTHTTLFQSAARPRLLLGYMASQKSSGDPSSPWALHSSLSPSPPSRM